MKKLIVLVLLYTAFSCSIEELDKTEEPTQIEQSPSEMGFLAFKGELASPELTEKNIPVPSCGESKPSALFYKAKDFFEQEVSGTLPITINGNSFTTANLALAVGAYTMEELYLIDDNGTMTHAVPNVVDPRFPFASYVSISLPFSISIIDDPVTSKSLEFLCYTSISLDYQGEAEFSGDITELVPYLVYNYSGSCVSKMSIQVLFNGVPEFEPITIIVQDDTPYVIPIPGYNSLLVTTYNSADHIVDEIYYGVVKEELYNWGTISHVIYNDAGDMVDEYQFSFDFTADGEFDRNGDGVFDANDTQTLGWGCPNATI